MQKIPYKRKNPHFLLQVVRQDVRRRKNKDYERLDNLFITKRNLHTNMDLTLRKGKIQNEPH